MESFLGILVVLLIVGGPLAAAWIVRRRTLNEIEAELESALIAYGLSFSEMDVAPLSSDKRKTWGLALPEEFAGEFSSLDQRLRDRGLALHLVSDSVVDAPAKS